MLRTRKKKGWAHCPAKHTPTPLFSTGIRDGAERPRLPVVHTLVGNQEDGIHLIQQGGFLYRLPAADRAGSPGACQPNGGCWPLRQALVRAERLLDHHGDGLVVGVEHVEEEQLAQAQQQREGDRQP